MGVGGRHAGDPYCLVGGRHAGDLVLWNQKGADSGAFLFAGMARSYINQALGRRYLNPALGSGQWSSRCTPEPSFHRWP